MTPKIVWLSSGETISRQLLGGKGAGLLILNSLGLPVPLGFILTTAFFTSNARGELSSSQKAHIAAAYLHLSQKTNERQPAVAIRSSAVAEDGDLHSFAGVHDTFLGICGIEDVIENVSRCQESLFSARARLYRAKLEEANGTTAVLPQMAVVVQVMVPARASGVMMTLNPSNGDRSKIIIESTWGLGQSLVEGTIIPDRYLIDKVTNQLIETKLAIKSTKLHLNSSATSSVTKTPVKANKQEMPSLTQEELMQLAEYGRFLEEHFGIPQDIEFATTKDYIYVLQTRPETVWSQKKPKPKGLQSQPIEHIINTLTNFGKST